jgi:hypothetical protein
MDETAVEVRLGHHDDSIRELKKHDDKQWVEIGKLRESIANALTRLIPVWVGVVLTMAGLITGSALTFAGVIFKFAKFA